MDTSPQYIKMCIKAYEIQEFRNNDDAEWCGGMDGDFVILDENHLDEIDIVSVSSFDPPLIWLPRQDQLQDMINGESFVGYLLNPVEYLHLIQEYNYSIDYDFESMEQLLLSFIMKEKFNKQWNPDKEIWQ